MADDAKVKLTLPMSGYGQPNTKTCWYACYAMMYGWKSKTVDDLKSKLTDAGYTLSSLLSRGLDQAEYGKLCHAVGMAGVQRVGAQSL